MTAEIWDISDGRRHLEGIAACVVCGQEWEAVAVAGTVNLECPGCGCWRGVWKFPYCGPRDGEQYQCAKCHGHVFYVVRAGLDCLGCGFLHKWAGVLNA